MVMERRHRAKKAYGKRQIYPGKKVLETPRLIWSPVYGTITENGNYLFFRRAVESKNVFWKAKTKPKMRKSGYYMPKVFHKIMGWVFIPKLNAFYSVRKPVWGDQCVYEIGTRIINEETISDAMQELNQAMAE